MPVKKRICHISTVHPLFDDRIFYKECMTLSCLCEVFFIVKHTSDEKIHDINIIGLPQSDNRFYRIFILSVIAFFKALRLNPCVVHIHDPELLWFGMFFRLLGKKTVYDVHEDVPLQILNKEWMGKTWMRYALSKFFSVLEKVFSLFYHKIIGVTTQICGKFPSKKTILLRNFPRLDMVKRATSNDKIQKKTKVVIYAGSLAKDRGIMELIDAIEFTSAELWLVGPWESSEFENLCIKSPGWKKTTYFQQKFNIRSNCA